MIGIQDFGVSAARLRLRRERGSTELAEVSVERSDFGELSRAVESLTSKPTTRPVHLAGYRDSRLDESIRDMYGFSNPLQYNDPSAHVGIAIHDSYLRRVGVRIGS